MRRRARIPEMHHRPLRRWARLFPAIVGLTSLACCCSVRAQRNPLPDLTPTPRLDLSTDLSATDLSATDLSATDLLAKTDLPAITPASKDVLSEVLPDAPTPNVEETNPDATNPDASASSTSEAPQQNQRQTTPGFPPVSPMSRRLPPGRAEHPSVPSLPSPCQAGVCTSTPANMCCTRNVNYFQRFVDAGIHPLTPRQKAYLALRNTVDPYNFATIGFFSAISVASDPNSAYGPGFPGFGRNFGVAYCENAVNEFFGTFLIPSIAHQDPHYHRMPNASYPRRALHAVTAVVWAQSDYGLGMPNYSTLITTVVGDGLGNLYVPGRQKSWGSAAARDVTAIATDPIGNFITEFLPDVARRVNVRIVLVQQIVNQVEKQP
jgi:hypothetical protein